MLPAVCLSLLLANPDRPLEPVATLGRATMVCRDYGRIFATPDGKRAVTARGEWFDLEAGRPIDPPFPLPKDSVVHSVLDDGTVVVKSPKHLLFFPPGATKPKRTLETLGRQAWLTRDGQVAISLQGWTDDTISLLVADKSGKWATVAEDLPPVVRLAVNTAGTHVALLFSGYGDVAVFDLKTKRRTDFLEERPKPPQPGPNGEILIQCFADNRRTDVALSADGKLVYVARSGDVSAFDSNSGEELEEKAFEARWWQGVPLAHVGVVRQFENHSLAWIGDGSKQVRVTDGGVIRIFDTATSKQTDTHSKYPGLYGVTALDDRRAITWTEDGHVITWDLVTDKPVADVQLDVSGFVSLRFGEVTLSSDENELIARDGSDFGHAIHADSRTGRKLFGDSGLHPVFGPDGRVLIVSLLNNTLTKRADETPIIQWSGFDAPKLRLHFDPVGRLAVVVMKRDAEVYEMATGKRRWGVRLPDEQLTRPYGGGVRRSGLFGRELVLVREADVLVYDLPTQKLLRHFALEPGNQKSAAVSADGRWLVVVSARTDPGPDTFTLFPLDHPNPVAAAVELPIRPSTYTTGVAFTPDGKKLLTSHAGGTAHAWDISRFTSPETNPRAAVLWDGLGSEEEKVVGEVMAEMAQTPQVTLRLLAKRLTPIPPLDEKAVKARIAELGSADFRTREAATAALAAMDERVLPLLKAAAEATSTPEVAERLDKILGTIDTREPPPEWARQLRAVELLETVGGREAERILSSLAGGAPGARLTTEAEQTLRRMRAKK